MFSIKKNYFFIIQNTRDIKLSNIKKNNKFNIIYRNKHFNEKFNTVLNFRKTCKTLGFKFYVANDARQAKKLKADGLYLSAYNSDLKILRYKSSNFDIIGSVHNFKELFIKKKQGCSDFFLSRLFETDYKNKKDFLGKIKFNLFTRIVNEKIYPLGGIRLTNINQMSSINCEGFAILSEAKKKPAIFSRLF